MNKDRRKRLEDLSEQIDIIKNELEEIRDEEQEARDNLPDNLQESSKAERMDEIIQTIEESMEYLEQVCDGIQKAIQG